MTLRNTNGPRRWEPEHYCCFDPITLTAAAIGVEASTVATAATVASAGLTAAGTYMQAQGQAEAAETNAKIAEQNATVERQAAAGEAERLAGRRRMILGAQRTAAAAAGVVPDTGSAGLLLNETERNSALDIATTIWNRDTAATAYENRASALRAEASATRSVAPIAAGGSFLSGLGKTKAGVSLTS